MRDAGAAAIADELVEAVVAAMRSVRPSVQTEQVTGFSAPMVLKWRNRYIDGGIEALCDVQRPGREREIDELELAADTLANDANPPAELGLSQWPARIIAERSSSPPIPS